MIRCAHISDLHFAKPSWKVNQFFSKRWIGNANFYLRRRSQFCFKNIKELPSLFKQLNISKVLITGDLTTTSDEKEFLMAQAFIQRLEEQGLSVLLLPGNHDQYTKAAFSNKTYYHFFPSSFSSPALYNLKEDGLTTVALGNKWSAVFLDTAIATPPLACYGFFSIPLEEKLKQALTQIPKNHRILILNHFPLICDEAPEKGLKRSEALCDIIKAFPQINLYLHGHTHHHCIADLRPCGLPIVLDSGSIIEKKTGAWNLIELHDEEFSIEAFKRINHNWQPTSRSYFKVNDV